MGWEKRISTHEKSKMGREKENEDERKRLMIKEESKGWDKFKLEKNHLGIEYQTIQRTFTLF